MMVIGGWRVNLNALEELQIHVLVMGCVTRLQEFVPVTLIGEAAESATYVHQVGTAGIVPSSFRLPTIERLLPLDKDSLSHLMGLGIT